MEATGSRGEKKFKLTLTDHEGIVINTWFIASVKEFPKNDYDFDNLLDDYDRVFSHDELLRSHRYDRSGLSNEIQNEMFLHLDLPDTIMEIRKR